MRLNNYQLIHSDAVKWARRYAARRKCGEDLPLFHALFGDPPYHLSTITKRFGKPGSKQAQYGRDGAFQRASRGFMGKKWDGGDVAFRPSTWRAFYRILHPGAFGMVFGGSRTSHRMAVAIEDAGFRIHPQIGWVYGCLSEDTEILTIDGWKTYDQVSTCSMVVCYNIDKDNLDYQSCVDLSICD